MRKAERWPEYLAEAAALAIFMISAAVFTTLVEHYRSPVLALVPSPVVRRALTGLAMGMTLVAIVYSPIGARSGAHMNPAVTLAFARLGRVEWADALVYMAAQFAGGILGMLVAWALVGRLLAEPAVYFIVTRPGDPGTAAAALAELAISFVMMSVILRMAAQPRTTRWTGAAAGVLLALYITVEGPLSGTSMNPARTLGSALVAGQFDSLWIYFAAPPAGMLAAAEWFRRGRQAAMPCAKLHHSTAVRCIFCGHEPPARDLCITT